MKLWRVTFINVPHHGSLIVKASRRKLVDLWVQESNRGEAVVLEFEPLDLDRDAELERMWRELGGEA